VLEDLFEGKWHKEVTLTLVELTHELDPEIKNKKSGT